MDGLIICIFYINLIGIYILKFCYLKCVSSGIENSKWFIG